jgi:hypothetical protein
MALFPAFGLIKAEAGMGDGPVSRFWFGKGGGGGCPRSALQNSLSVRVERPL